MSMSGDNNNIYGNSGVLADYNIDSQQILYFKQDTIDFDAFFHESIFIFSETPQDSLYRVTFTNVGNGNGDYVLESSLINGNVFKWISPVNGLSQGNYSPIKILPQPKKQQMISFGCLYEKDYSTISLNFGISHHDKNLFSNLDDNNNIGFGTKLLVKRKIPYKKITITPSISYEFINKKFSFIERTKEIEFYRDWGGIAQTEDQKLLNVSLNTKFNETNYLYYSFENMKVIQHNKVKNSIDGY